MIELVEILNQIHAQVDLSQLGQIIQTSQSRDFILPQV